MCRHPHNPDMVAVTHSLSWPAYFLLDVAAVLLLLLAALTLALVKLVKCCGCRHKHSKEKHE